MSSGLARARAMPRSPPRLDPIRTVMEPDGRKLPHQKSESTLRLSVYFLLRLVSGRWVMASHKRPNAPKNPCDQKNFKAVAGCRHVLPRAEVRAATPETTMTRVHKRAHRLNISISLTTISGGSPAKPQGLAG
jgi:hypothetical protein